MIKNVLHIINEYWPNTSSQQTEDATQCSQQDKLWLKPIKKINHSRIWSNKHQWNKFLVLWKLSFSSRYEVCYWGGKAKMQIIKGDNELPSLDDQLVQPWWHYVFQIKHANCTLSAIIVLLYVPSGACCNAYILKRLHIHLTKRYWIKRPWIWVVLQWNLSAS